MSVFYVHLSWFIFILIALVLSLLMALYLTFYTCRIYFSLPLFTSWFLPLEVSFYLDWISSWFTVVILLITCIISVYSYNYIAPYSKPGYFLWFTMLFVASILLVVNIRDLFFIMLGWDGLGIVSFFLIVYYQNHSSITSGLFTVFINRLGDAFFLLTLGIFIHSSYTYGIFYYSHLNYLPLAFLILTFITKRAIYPFSSWLPIAMAAPTPISALVHSSTLVTSGLYLIIRFSSYLYSSDLINYLVVICLFTSFYAGMNTLFERDLKKLIALSTLSHLGFIGLSFSLGIINLAYFHILTHALFKSLLFMTIGDVIINLSHSQDIRYLSSGIKYTPFSRYMIHTSLLNLLGLPSLRGYFSKDLVLEFSYYSNTSVFLLFILLINVLFTYYYTYQLYFYSYQSNKVLPYMNHHTPKLIHGVLLLFLSFIRVVFGRFFIKSICSTILYPAVPSIFKLYPIFMVIVIFLFLYLFIYQFSYKGKYITSYFASMIFLSKFMIRVSSQSYFNLAKDIVKTGEQGSFTYYINQFPSEVVTFISNRLLLFSSSIPTLVVLCSSLFYVVFLVILLSNIKYYVWLLITKSCLRLNRSLTL